MGQRGVNREGAAAIHRAAMNRVRDIAGPKGQKFPRGARVKIMDDLGPSMSHFPVGKVATVLYTYAHAYGGDDVKSYCLDIDGLGCHSWYDERHLTPVEDDWPDVVHA